MTNELYHTRINFKNYLPNTLRNMAGLTPKRQLVKDVQQSSIFSDEFPILEKEKNFTKFWGQLTTKIRDNVYEFYDGEDVADFVSDWNQFAIEIETRLEAFSDESLTSVPRRVMDLWEDVKDRIEFITPILEYDETIFLDYLNSVLNPSTNNIWEDFAENIEDILDDYIHPHINTLSNIREVTTKSDGQVINLTARLLGFDFRDELLNAFGKERVATIIPIIGEAYKIASTDDFIKLVEFTIGSRILMEHLYSRDYINFKTYREMRSGTHKGPMLLENAEAGTYDWFKTTHINLFVEYGQARYLAASVNATLGATLLEIIEHFIPANLVLKNFGLTYAVNTPKTAPGVFFCSEVGPRSGYRYVITDELQETRKIKEKPPITAMIFDNAEQVDTFLDYYIFPKASTIVESFGRFSKNNWYAPASAPAKDSVFWQVHPNPLNINSLEYVPKVSDLVGLVSVARTLKYEFEATLFSTSEDDGAISLIAAFKPPDDEGFENGNKNVLALHFVRSHTANNNWIVNFQDGTIITRIYNGSRPITAGFPQPAKKGWKASGSTKIRILRDGNIIKGYTSKYGSDTIDLSTEIIINLTDNVKTRALSGNKSYGYSVQSQANAGFKNISISGEFENNALYNLEDDIKYQYDMVTKKWIERLKYEFKDYFQAKNFFLNPINQVVYYLDGVKVVSRVTPYI